MISKLVLLSLDILVCPMCSSLQWITCWVFNTEGTKESGRSYTSELVHVLFSSLLEVILYTAFIVFQQCHKSTKISSESIAIDKCYKHDA